MVCPDGIRTLHERTAGYGILIQWATRGGSSTLERISTWATQQGLGISPRQYLYVVLQEDRVDCVSFLLTTLSGRPFESEKQPSYWNGQPVPDSDMSSAARLVGSVAMVKELARFGFDLLVQTDNDSLPYLRVFRPDLAQAFREAKEQYMTLPPLER